jgi:alpha-N-arabinofuranosidase
MKKSEKLGRTVRWKNLEFGFHIEGFSFMRLNCIRGVIAKSFGSTVIGVGLTLILTVAAHADPATLTLDAGNASKHVSPTFYGLMTEEINHSYDGGLYAELIQNRSFKDNANEPAHWAAVQEKGGEGSIALDDSQSDTEALPVPICLRLDVTKGGGRVGIANDGYWGIPVKPDTEYRASFYAKGKDSSAGPFTVSIESNDGATTFAQAEVEKISDQWHKYTVTLKTAKDAAASATTRFVISTAAPGTFWFDLVSLFPPTFHDRPNGNRPDIMQLMAGLKPAFLRCPGGNYLEGDTVETRFNWLNTLGDISQRPGHMGCWSYRSSDGLGLLEFLEWSEDIGAQPVLAVYAGYSLNDKQHPRGIAAGDDLKPFVDEAIEEIEYATGGPETKWGAKRAADGHPAPFPIEYVEIGNEDFLGGARRTYEARFAQFYDALKAAYPQLKFIATTPVKGRTPDVIDDHYYKTSDQMAALAHKYDKTNRDGPKVFVGEWATREVPKTDASGKTTYVMMPWAYKGEPTPAFHAALGDAAFMTGLERNADVVVLNAYAPMLTRVEPGAGQWCPNMIGYNALSSFGSPSYYAQQMFNSNRGDIIVSGSMSTEPKDFFYSATRSTKTGTIFVKAVNRGSDPITVQIDLTGVNTISPDGDLTVLTSDDPQAVNTIEEPTKVVPVTSKIHNLGSHFTQTFAPNSANVLKMDAQ